MARTVGVSPAHFSRLFRAHTGKPPNRFYIETRLEVAQTMLEFSRMNISQIAERLGYPDAFAFSHQFKKYVGISPSEWRDARAR